MSSYRQSAWDFHTSAGVGAGLGPFLISRGMIVLDEPKTKTARRFDYSAFGMGITSTRLPKRFQLPSAPLPRGREFSGTGSTTDFWSDGIVFMNQTFRGTELTVQDLTGGAFIEDAGGGVLMAKNYTAMHVGIPKALVLAAYANPVLLVAALNNAKAIIVMKGVSEGLVDGVALTSSVGVLEFQGTYSE